ncbi:MAG TPA: prepilin-type N-terminal cleavage/methylation domain-containing protein [Myxococcaceae bacterium]|jgi:type IV pilus assembly protein PilA
MKKLHKGFTLIELMIVVAIIGILAALAIPNFIKFQARSKQSEAKSNLKGLFTAERSYYQEHDTYTSCVRTMGFNPERANRYRYTVNTTVRADEACGGLELRQDAAGVTANTDGDIQADAFKYSVAATTAANAAPAAATYAPVAPLNSNTTVAANLVGVVPPAASPLGSFGGAAQGNVDSDTALDVWFVSSVSGITPGEAGCAIAAGLDQQYVGGEPKNTYNDVQCP